MNFGYKITVFFIVCRLPHSTKNRSWQQLFKHALADLLVVVTKIKLKIKPTTLTCFDL